MSEERDAGGALTELQQQELCSILLLGCDVETACDYVGVARDVVGTAARQRREFGRRLQRAAAAAEIHHMRNIHAAAKEEKNWRASVWWLERMEPTRYARQPGPAIGGEHLDAAAQSLAAVILREIDDPAQRQRLARALADAADAVAGLVQPETAPPSTAVELDPAPGGEADATDLA